MSADSEVNAHLTAVRSASRKIAEIIKAKVALAESLHYEIDEIAKKHIPDFHFMDYEVSTFWECEQSPIGMCVWTLVNGRGHPFEFVTCRYCGGPVTRK